MIRAEIKYILRFPELHVYSGVTIGKKEVFDRHALTNMSRQDYCVYDFC